MLHAHDYTTFGMCLLQDENGEEVALIEKDHISKGAENITQAILQKWLTSDFFSIIFFAKAKEPQNSKANTNVIQKRKNRTQKQR